MGAFSQLLWLILIVAYVFRDRILGMTGFISTLLNSPNCHALNLSDYEGAKKLVDQLVRLDRLPKENPIEGLLLMQEAWGLYDVAMHLADQYKLWSKVIFFIQLLLVFLVVISTAIGSLTFTITQEGEGRRLQLVSSDGGEFVSVWLPSLSGAGIVEDLAHLTWMQLVVERDEHTLGRPDREHQLHDLWAVLAGNRDPGTRSELLQ